MTNAAADCWTIARRGTEKARAELPSYNIDMYVVSEATAAAQRQVLDNLLTNGVAGVSISAIDPANPTEILYKIASQAVLLISLRGGEGSILGIVVRAILLQVLQNLVNLLGIQSSLNFAVMGTVILLGALADQQLQRRRQARLAARGRIAAKEMVVAQA
ncbi:MAG: hypothetical protein WAS21_10280 [Geminicoccaceae bacterium]